MSRQARLTAFRLLRTALDQARSTKSPIKLAHDFPRADPPPTREQLGLDFMALQQDLDGQVGPDVEIASLERPCVFRARLTTPHPAPCTLAKEQVAIAALCDSGHTRRGSDWCPRNPKELIMSAQQAWYENGEQLGRFFLWLIIGVWRRRFFVCVLVDRTSSLCQIDVRAGPLEVSSRIV